MTKYPLPKEKPQDLGYRHFFTNNYEGKMVAMQFARANNNLNESRSDYMSPLIIKDTYISGAMHFGGVDYTKYDTHRYFDLDIKEAYATFLLNYKRGNFGYYVGGGKTYYQDYDFFTPNRKYDGVVFHRINFAIVTKNVEKSRLYRHWILKSNKINGFRYTDNIIQGIILIPDIDNLPNRFLDEVYGYDDYDVRYEGTITTTGKNAVYINEDKIIKALMIKNDDTNPYQDFFKLMLNSSTGYLAHADKLLYYTMINQVRSELIRLMSYIDKYNEGKSDYDRIQILAANTDGITVYAHKDMEIIINSLLDNVNNYSYFTFLTKEIYEIAHETPHDVRKAKEWQKERLN